VKTKEKAVRLCEVYKSCSTTEFELGFPMIAQRIDQNVGEGDFTPTGL
jgi:hypothetical protein